MVMVQCIEAGRIDSRSKPIPIGARFGNLEVVAYAGSNNGAVWECVCSCGSDLCKKEVLVRAGHLRAGGKIACGCKRSMPGLTMLERAKKRATVTESGCWLWIRPCGKYPRSSVKGKCVTVHRQIWEEVNGKIPDGLSLLHNCPGSQGDDRRCVNPAHMYVGTQANNMEDARDKDQVPFGERNARSKLTTVAVATIYKDYWAGGKTQEKLAEEHSISESQISRIVNRKFWKRATQSVANFKEQK